MSSVLPAGHARRTAVVLVLAAALWASPGGVLAQQMEPHQTAQQTVLTEARSHLGAAYQYGGTGPRFDCSGLVYRVFKDSRQLARVGGKRMTAAALLRWFRARGLAGRGHGKRGDLVSYGGGSHVGIYMGGGRVISAIVRGVRKHGLHSLTIPFTAFLHTRLGDAAAQAQLPGPRAPA